MARPQKNHALFTTPYSPITERQEEEEEQGVDVADYYSDGGCGCFRRFCFGWDGADRHNHLLQESGAHNKETWVGAQLKKLKQLSELVAGPKWKNLIRKVGKFCSPKNHNTHNTQSQYSPESYALNFSGDDHDNEEEENGSLLHSFSSRFAPRALINDQQRRAGQSFWHS